MDWLLQRYSDNGNSTQGLFFEKALPVNLWHSHALEDEYRKVKIKGETRFDAGLYELKIVKIDTPLTLKHRQTYNIAPFGEWFKFHIEITGLPRHSSVYVHAGNEEDDTDACLLLGDTIHNNTIEKDRMQRSIQAVKRFYDRCYPYLESGKRSYIEVRDEVKLI